MIDMQRMIKDMKKLAGEANTTVMKMEGSIILIKLYKVSESLSTRSTSFIDEKINNLLKHMKFVKSPIQTRPF